MDVLVIDASPAIDPTVLRPLYMGGYALTKASTINSALKLIDRTEFDCILVDIHNSVGDDEMGVAEIRQFARKSAVALVTSEPLERIVHELLADGSIELQSVPDLITNVGQLPQPALLVSSGFQPNLIKAIKDKGLCVSRAGTLQFAMNLLVDGWCQIVLLEADIDGLNDPEKVAIFRQVKAKQLGILASASVDALSGVTFGTKPQTAARFIALFEQTVGNRLSPCGSSESLGRQRRFEPEKRSAEPIAKAAGSRP